MALASSDAILQVRQLSKSFGGVQALRGVTLEVFRGEVHAIIGPNGAGKTTLVSILSGEVRPDSGTVTLFGEDVTQLTPYQIVKRGMSRSYQITSLFEAMSVADNVALAVQRVENYGFRMLADAKRLVKVRDRTSALLSANGLYHLQDVPVGRISHGDKRVLELCLALACDPRVLILDEPTAGMGHEESERVIELLAGLSGKYTLILIEHDMDAVFRLADRISVFVEGRPVITDRPDVVRCNAKVRAAYLGEDHPA